MASMPEITVPLTGKLLGGLRCSPCTDQAIADDADLTAVPGADTMAPVPLITTVLGQQVASVVVIPVCNPCRKAQLGPVSKSGLAVA